MYSYYDYFFPKKSIIIELFVGKENNNHSNTHIIRENILVWNVNCIILNSFVLPLGMVLHILPTKLSRVDRKIRTIEKI